MVRGLARMQADSAWVTVDALTTVLAALPAELSDDVLPDLPRAQVDPEVLPLFTSCEHPAAPQIVDLLTNRPATSVIVTPSTRRPLGLVGIGYQIKVHLHGVTRPSVWRRLRLPADLTLRQLHHVIQAAMGWDDDHLHAFTDDQNGYGPPGNGLRHGRGGMSARGLRRRRGL